MPQGMVISLGIKETEMGDRGSKSELRSILNSVKEQRVDGSSTIYNYFCNNVVRYTLVTGKPAFGRNIVTQN